VAALLVTGSWLTALAGRDREALERLSSPFLEVVGFWLGNGPERRGCGQETDRENELSARVADGLTVTKIVECVMEDPVLVDSIPQYPWEWPEKASKPDAQGRVGYLRPLNLQAVPSRLARYRRELSAAGPGGTLATFFVTDGGGATSYGAVVVRLVAGNPRVASVFIDDLFQE
jgi:hypothetical protein